MTDHTTENDVKGLLGLAALGEEAEALGLIAECPNGHGEDGMIPCWSPGGPCPADQTVCETCGPCYFCRPGEHPAFPPDERSQ